MLKTMRKNIKALKPTLWIVIATFIIAIFAIWGGAGRLGESRQSNNLVTIGRERISSSVARSFMSWAIWRSRVCSTSC